MRLVVFSHKETWPYVESASGYATTGGFPIQMRAISQLFDQTHLLLLQRDEKQPGGLQSLTGYNLTVRVLPEPAGKKLYRKISMIVWLPRYLPIMWRSIRDADAVHAPVPGDMGMIGILLALVLCKPLFIRHCGTWAMPQSMVDRFLFWLLERIAGGRNVVLATGEANNPPSDRNPNIHWIFSTSMTKAELASLQLSRAWCVGSPLQLITVARLVEEKNIQAIIHAICLIKKQFPEIHLSIIGDGSARLDLEKLARELGLADQVHFYGNCSHVEVMGHLADANLFILPTRVNEGFPKVVLEAMACGLPVIASNISAIPSLIRDCGIVLEKPEPEIIAKAIIELLENPSNLSQLGHLARQKALDYSLESWQAKIEEHLSAAWGERLREHS